MTSGGDGNQDDLADAWGADLGLDDEGIKDDEGGSQDDLAAAWGAETGLEDEEGGQDDLAAAWGADLGIEGGDDGGGGGEVAAQWASLVDGGMDDSSSERAARLLSQGEIDSLLGYKASEGSDNDLIGIKAILNSGIVSYERLPMLEIIFDRLVRLLTTSLRNFTSDNVEVTLDSITTIRFGEYMNSIPLPAMLAVFHAREWDNFGMVTVESNLIYSIVDVLLGGRGSDAIRVEGRPYTTIETNLVKRMIEVVLEDTENAFRPLSPVTFDLDRLETNPRFATIARESNAAIRVELRIDMEDRGGRIEVVLPLSTLEPIRELLLQGFMGEKFGNDTIWEEHLAHEIWNTELPVEAILYEMSMPLQRLLKMQVGETVMLECAPDDPISIKSGNVALSEGVMGSKNGHVAIRLNSGISLQSEAANGAPQDPQA
ncbi:MAG: flagellar motor switch protein FliM [bacterium]|nr:flagellar motor switch protein FliM [bacterium]